MIKKTMISAAILFSLSSIGISANANEIKFTGTITTSTCKLADDSQVLNVVLPTFGISDVQAVGQHRGVSRFNVNVKCEGKKEAGSVTMAFMPTANSVNGKILKNSASGASAAKGVGIVVIDNEGKNIDFDNNAQITTPMNGDTGTIILAATYAKDGSGDVKPGAVSANLPFVMTYE